MTRFALSVKISNVFPLRLIVSAIIAVTIVAAMDQYFFSGLSYWPIIAAFLMIQLERNAGVRQKVILLFVMLLAVLIAALWRSYFHDLGSQIVFVMSAYLLISIYLFCSWVSVFLIQMLTIFFILLAINVLLPITLFKAYPIEHQTLGILVGAGFGMLSSYLINPLQYGRDFKAGVVPVFNALNDYLNELKGRLQYQPSDLQTESVIATDNKMPILNIDSLVHEYKRYYPEWVYAAGFNPGLRAGLRYYLIKLDQLIEVFFSTDLYFLQLSKMQCVVVDQKLFLRVIEQNQKLIEAVIIYFQQARYNPIAESMTEDIQQLDDELAKVLPINMELVDMNPCHMFLLHMARNLRDMRALLLQLMMSVI